MQRINTGPQLLDGERIDHGNLVVGREPIAKPQQPSPVKPTCCNTELILIRGLPGSGKTTMATVLVLIDYKHFEADMFFTLAGVYRYEASKVRNAHEWCIEATRNALEAGSRVVVSNTFTRLNEMEPYLSMTKNLKIIEARGTWENTHGVPKEMLDRMASRWEPLIVR